MPPRCGDTALHSAPPLRLRPEEEEDEVEERQEDEVSEDEPELV